MNLCVIIPHIDTAAINNYKCKKMEGEKLMFKKALPRSKKFKLFLYGPPGGFKTRTMLRLANVPDGDPEALAIVDTEFGSDHYADEFNFLRLQTNDPDEIFNATKRLLKSPGKIKTLGFDSFSVYYASLMAKYVDLYLKREISSKGHKKEYYVLQPRDYQPINREAEKFIRMLLSCDLNVIVTCQSKEQWGDNMKVIGSTFDGFKRLPYYFDTSIEVEENKRYKSGFSGTVKLKDRTNKLKVGEKIPWENDQAIYDYLVKSFGQDFSTGPDTVGYQDDEVKIHPVEKAVSSKEDTNQTAPIFPPFSLIFPPGTEHKSEPKQEELKSKSDFKKQINDSEEPVHMEQLKNIVKLKSELKIHSKKEWAELLKMEPFNVNSAKEFTIDMANEFIRMLVLKKAGLEYSPAIEEKENVEDAGISESDLLKKDVFQVVAAKDKEEAPGDYDKQLDIEDDDPGGNDLPY